MSEYNPIYVEYSAHENCDAYKIDLPWSRYGKDTVVLCKVSDGLDMARLLAVGVINRHLDKALTTV